jgi:hypothetical protein
MRRISWIIIGLACFGCARGPNVGSEQLPLRRVVVYRNGVGYFERSGQVDEERVSFRMRQRMVGDFLASLAVIERGGSSVRSASFPLELEDAEKPAPVEPEPRPMDAPEMGANGRPTPPPPEKKPDPNAMRDVVLHLDGKEHSLLIGYLSETPVWRPSYRVVVADDGRADLQAWGIVQNLSGEDWENVSLSLVAGAPLAFQSTLGTPVIPERPVVTDQGEVLAVVPTGVTSLDQSGMDAQAALAPEAPAAEPAPADEAANAYDSDQEAREEAASAPSAQKKERRLSRGMAAGAAAPRPSMAPAPAPPPAPGRPALSPPRRLSDLAAVALEAGATRYDLPYPVTIPNESATMVLLTSQRVPGEAVFLFAPESGVGESHTHPFRVARFTNTSPGLLERGPIAVFEKGSFLGQGMLEPLPPRATATVPFALERGVAVLRDYRQEEQGARVHHIEAGTLFIERDEVQRTIYRIDSGNDRKSKLLVKHPRLPGTRLYQPPAGTSDDAATSSALVPVDLRPRAKTELVVDERRGSTRAVDWLEPIADEAVKSYVADTRANPDVARKLREAWVIRDLLRKALDEHDKLSNERSTLEQSSDETRRSLKAIEKNPQAADLRAKLTKRLGEAATRLDTIVKRTIELQMVIDENRVRFRDAIRDVSLEAAPPPKD